MKIGSANGISAATAVVTRCARYDMPSNTLILSVAAAAQALITIRHRASAIIRIRAFALINISVDVNQCAAIIRQMDSSQVPLIFPRQ
jgi:hypothetical protein